MVWLVVLFGLFMCFSLTCLCLIDLVCLWFVLALGLGSWLLVCFVRGLLVFTPVVCGLFDSVFFGFAGWMWCVIIVGCVWLLLFVFMLVCYFDC